MYIFIVRGRECRLNEPEMKNRRVIELIGSQTVSAFWRLLKMQLERKLEKTARQRCAYCRRRRFSTGARRYCCQLHVCKYFDTAVDKCNIMIRIRTEYQIVVVRINNCWIISIDIAVSNAWNSRNKSNRSGYHRIYFGPFILSFSLAIL